MRTALKGVEQGLLRRNPERSGRETVDVAPGSVEGDKERVQVFSGTVIMRKGRGD